MKHSSEPHPHRWKVYAGHAALVVLSMAMLAGCGDNALNPLIEKAPEAAVSGLHGEYPIAGASSQLPAAATWIAGIETSAPDLHISYDPSGSGAGVSTFLQKGVSLAASDVPLSDEQRTRSQQACALGEAFEVPTYLSAIAFAYNLKSAGLNNKSNPVKLTPVTITRIFNGTLKFWDDAEIKAENPEIATKLPHLSITPVWRSDKSGTTETVEKFFHATASSEWTGTPQETWPFDAGQSAKGNAGISSTLQQAEGTIGYIDFSQVNELGAVSIITQQASAEKGEKEIVVAPGTAAATKTIAHSRLTTAGEAGAVLVDTDFAIRREGAYPLVLVSYQIACQTYEKDDTAHFALAWLDWVTSPAGQKSASQITGSAPLPTNVRKKVTKSIQAISSLKQASAPHTAASTRTTDLRRL